MTGPAVGRVAGLWRYPIKSMAPEAVERVEVAWHGIVGDRRWAFVRSGQDGSGFPWLTIRDQPEMVRYQPRLVDPARPNATAVRVVTPAGVELDASDPALAAELGAVRAMKLDRGAFDDFPLMLVSSQSVAAVGALVGRALAAPRFRPNILIDGDGAAYAEEAWIGATLRIGGLRMRIDKRDQRCMVINVDPDTGERDPAVLRTLGRERDTCLGVYGSVASPGVIAVGDPVILERGRADAT